MIKLFSKKYTKNIAIASVIAIFFISDRILKSTALVLGENNAFDFIPGLFSFSLTKNYFISFSLPLFGPFLNLAIAFIVVALFAYIIYLAKTKKGDRWEIILFSVLLVGAISNFYDRLSLGFVVDYLELKYFTVFNLADVMISLSSLLLIIKNFRLKSPQ